MKKSIILLLALGIQILVSCNSKPDVEKLLKEHETKSEIFKAITENHDYMTEFMETAHNNEHAMQMMMNKGVMMNNMHGNKNMMHQIMNDSTQVDKMLQMMHQRGMINYECIQSCMKKMNSKEVMDE
ncbi:hypothetical protein [Tenacibaculum larymnensis]|uniref:Lipoprotein n=1 Tax=Tenacibaculum larymnensis TaxID=2878201 RepID=A0A9X4ES89_9FLAO|nr:hypothetical protein [Tenacibaculum larymnensis]MDE1207932.1 hypothetical protein [Tenacibaculum larymnensis]